MRIPKSEPEAFRIAYGSALVAGACVLVGTLIAPLLGVALFGLVVVIALAYEGLAADPDRRRPLREAAHGPHSVAQRGRRILVVALESARGDGLRDELARHRPADVVVAAPVLYSRTHSMTTDVDVEIAAARKRLAETLDWARASGFEARGDIGDWTNPVTTIEDELRLFGADEVFIVSRAPDRLGRLETGVVERVRDELDLPITHVVVEGGRAELEA